MILGSNSGVMSLSINTYLHTTVLSPNHRDVSELQVQIVLFSNFEGNLLIQDPISKKTKQWPSS